MEKVVLELSEGHCANLQLGCHPYLCLIFEMMDIHERYMSRCLQLAGFGAGYVAPNPMVGALLVHDARIIAEGWHRRYGQAHAEVNCLQSVADSDKHLISKSTLYVSLEPCAHYGKTPPCAHRIVQEGIKKVVIGITDPFDEVNGRGISILKDAGVDVVAGILEKKCRWQNRRFFTFHEMHRPYVHLKWATTGDGFMSGKENGRLKITGAITDRLVHKWRSEEAAILVGTQTVLKDNPRLNNRHWSGPQPIRIFTDRELVVPEHSHLLSDGAATIVLNGKKSEVKGNVQWEKVENMQVQDPAALLNILYEMEIQSVLVEGGAAVLNSFLRSGLWDEAHVLTNKNLKSGGGVAAPEKPLFQSKDCFQVEEDLIEYFVNE